MAQAEIAEHQAEQAIRLAVGRRWRRAGALILGWIGFVGIWIIISRYIVGPYLLPDPLRVGAHMWEVIKTGLFIRHFYISVLKVFAGFGVAVLIGVPIGYLMGRSRYWRAFFHDPVIVAGSVPGLTYAVMALVIFGISFLGPILAVALISMPYIAINVAEGIQGVDQKLIAMSQAYHRNEQQILRHVQIPSVMPFVFAGVRLSFALAWKVEALTEVFGSSSGVGFMMRKEFEDFSVTGILAWILLFIIFMLFIERFILVRLEQRLFRWRGSEHEGQP